MKPHGVSCLLDLSEHPSKKRRTKQVLVMDSILQGLGFRV